MLAWQSMLACVELNGLNWTNGLDDDYDNDDRDGDGDSFGGDDDDDAVLLCQVE